MTLLRLIQYDHVTGAPLGREPKLRKKAAPLYAAYLGDELVCWSTQPMYDGARVLLAQGHDPETLLTTRWMGKGYDNFLPARIGWLAQWRVNERERGMSLERWVPAADAGAPSHDDLPQAAE